MVMLLTLYMLSSCIRIKVEVIQQFPQLYILLISLTNFIPTLGLFECTFGRSDLDYAFLPSS